ncbi:hypothetical protein FB45DRAFT_352982 [Roridomyces roridus]|uniref:Uncharacterized protein n=1 Tax=Roridomyces roridus TaxID=1738132 RepID=A0AAD7C6Z1_9AGAR|nr:hypothetical protein FB45DRAFT_352982 [Roridomyces roridus]
MNKEGPAETANADHSLFPLPVEISSRFPPELHNYTIDHLHDDRRSLSVCRLVCWAWYASSTYHLTFRVHRKNFREFCSTIIAEQRINPHIGRLQLESHDNDERAVSDRIYEFQFNEHLRYLTNLPSVRYLHLSTHIDTVSPSFVSALSQNFGGVTELHLSNFDFESFAQFLQVREALPLLRCITLVDVWWNDDRYPDVIDDTTPEFKRPAVRTELGQLDKVVIRCIKMTDVLLWLWSHTYIRRLEFGTLRRRPSHAILLSGILRALGTCLESLALHEPGYVDLLDFSHSSALRSVQIPRIRFLASVAWVPAFLEQLPPSRAQLDRITFNVIAEDFERMSLLDWSRMDEILAQDIAVKHVQFNVAMDRKLSVVVQYIEARLPSRTYTLIVR